MSDKSLDFLFSANSHCFMKMKLASYGVKVLPNVMLSSKIGEIKMIYEPDRVILKHNNRELTVLYDEIFRYQPIYDGAIVEQN